MFFRSKGSWYVKKLGNLMDARRAIKCSSKGGEGGMNHISPFSQFLFSQTSTHVGSHFFASPTCVDCFGQFGHTFKLVTTKFRQRWWYHQGQVSVLDSKVSRRLRWPWFSHGAMVNPIRLGDSLVNGIRVVLWLALRVVQLWIILQLKLKLFSPYTSITPTVSHAGFFAGARPMLLLCCAKYSRKGSWGGLLTNGPCNLTNSETLHSIHQLLFVLTFCSEKYLSISQHYLSNSQPSGAFGMGVRPIPHHSADHRLLAAYGGAQLRPFAWDSKDLPAVVGRLPHSQAKLGVIAAVTVVKWIQLIQLIWMKMMKESNDVSALFWQKMDRWKDTFSMTIHGLMFPTGIVIPLCPSLSTIFSAANISKPLICKVNYWIFGTLY